MCIGFQKSQSEVWGSQLYQDHPGVHMVQEVAYMTPVFMGESSDKNIMVQAVADETRTSSVYGRE